MDSKSDKAHWSPLDFTPSSIDKSSKSKTSNQSQFQKTGNSILQSNNFNSNQDIFDQADRVNEEDLPNQNSTGNNF